MRVKKGQNKLPQMWEKKSRAGFHFYPSRVSGKQVSIICFLAFFWRMFGVSGDLLEFGRVESWCLWAWSCAFRRGENI